MSGQTITKHELESKLEEYSRALRKAGWTVIRPDPFLKLHSQQKITSVFPASFEEEKQEAQSPLLAPAPVRLPPLQVPEHITKWQLSEWRLEIIREHAGKVLSQQIADMLGIKLGHLKQIASVAKISLKVKK